MNDKTSETTSPLRRKAASEVKTLCGVIMPISATLTHSEEHWRSVQTLLHRGIDAAGFEPRNVWESASTDRISERIIGNIFEVPIAVVDVSDLNPNVMLELGLRLASKKPTVVVANEGGDIPFDIRDFHATFYPPDMNMLGMEDFFRKLGKVLQEKHTAYSSESYTPFLGKVIVDVASPQTRELGLNELLLSRLEEISARLGSVELVVRRPRPSPSGGVPNRNARRAFPDGNARGTVEVEIPAGLAGAFINDALELFEIDEVTTKSEGDGKATLSVHFSGAQSHSAAWELVSNLAQKHGGEMEMPF
jgi:hypothetical protein